MSISRLAFVYCVLLTWCVDSFALSLGNVQGRVWLGSQLAVQIPVHLGTDEVGDDLCLQVLPAHSLEGSEPLSLDAELAATSAPQTKIISVRSRQSVQDLVVNFGVSVGCTNAIRRHYTLLIDPPSVPSEPPPASAAPRLNKVETPTPTPISVGRGVAPAEPNIAVAPTQATRAVRKTPPPNDAGHSMVQHNIADIVPNELNVNELEFLLKLKSDPTPPSFQQMADGGQREEFRLVWASLQVPLEVQISNNKEFSKLNNALTEKEEKIKIIENQKNQLHVDLEEEKAWYFHGSFIIPILLLGLSWIWFVGLFFNKSYPRGVGQLFKRKKTIVTLSPETQMSSAIGSQDFQGSDSKSGHLNFDSLFPENDNKNLKQHKFEFKSDVPATNFANSTLNDASRSVATEELFDLQQQVEFFISLGQANQAIEVLKSHISENEEHSPLAYLDLLKLQYDLGLKEDYEHTRKELNTRFNAGTPSFEQYTYSRRSLERYPLALSRIQALWPGPSVLALLERTIFKQDADDELAAIFDLEAYRELLLLYGIARELNNASDKSLSFDSIFSSASHKPPAFEVSGFPEFTPTRLQPLNATFIDDLNKNPSDVHDAENKNENSQFLDVFLDTLGGATEKTTPPKNEPTDQKTKVFSLKNTDDLKLDFSDLDTLDSGYTIKKSDNPRRTS